MSDRSNIYIISLVAIVAVVGLVTLFMPGGDSEGVPSGEIVMDEDGNIVGQAWYSPSKIRPSRYTRVLPKYTKTSTKIDTSKLTEPVYRKELTTTVKIGPPPCPALFEFYNNSFIMLVDAYTRVWVPRGNPQVDYCQETKEGIRVKIGERWCDYHNLESACSRSEGSWGWRLSCYDTFTATSSYTICRS